MENRFLSVFGSRTLVCDGAMGTMLAREGLPLGMCPELWNADNPDAVLRVHQAYVAAGADIVETNTFGGTPVKLRAYGLESRARELNRLAAEIARESGVLVAGSVGPTGQLLDPYGDLTRDEASEAFAEQMRGLAEGGVDLLIIETMSDLNEMMAAIEPAVRSGLPTIACMSFDMGGRTMMGVSPSAFAQALGNSGVVALGTNCGGGCAQLTPVVEELLAASSIPVVAMPNAGLPSLVEGKAVFMEDPSILASFADSFRGRLSVVGSCCGSTPAHTKAVVEALRGL